MQSLQKRLLPALCSGVLLLLVICTVSINQAKADSNIPIQGAVYSVHRSDGSQKTYVDIVISRRYTDKLPDSIDSITVSGPAGSFKLNMNDFRYNPEWRSFWSVRSGVPMKGTYRFIVTSGKNIGQATDTQTTVVKIPLPETRRFYPTRGNVISCKPPIFSWRQLNSDRPLFYQVEIQNSDRQHVYRSRYVRDMESIRLPVNTLNPGKSYRWRVRVADRKNWREMNNRSQSRWVAFSTSKSLKPCQYRYQPPKKVAESWDVASLDEQRIDPEIIQELIQQVLNNRFSNIHGILLIKNGKLVLEEYFEGYHRNLIHSVASVTKSFISTLIGIAGDRGEKIVLDEKLSSYLPEYSELISKTGLRDITLRHVLTMTAGFEWNELHHPTDLLHMIESQDAIGYVLTRRLIDPPGQRFHYNTGLSTVLGRVLKNTTGLDALQFAERHLFAPLAIEDYSWGKVADGSYSTGAALRLRPRDMAKFGYLFLKNGIWKGQRIISEKWVKESIYPHITDDRDMVSGSGYGYQWWSGTLRSGDQDIEVYYAAGHGGQCIVQIPSLDVVAVTTSRVENNNSGDFRAASILENYIVPAVLRQDPVTKRPTFNAEDYQHLTGIYRWSKAKLNLKISIKKGKIYGETVLFKDKFEIIPIKNDHFISTSNDIGKLRIEMLKDSKGGIKDLQLSVGFTNLIFERKRGLIFGF